MRDITKVEETEIEVKEKANIGDLVWIVGERFPNLRDHLNVVSLSINSEYATKEQGLKDGDEVGLLPPISGG